MNSKIELSQQINYALSNYVLTDEVRSLLLDISNELEKDLSKEQKMQLWLKWASLFKDFAVVASNILKGPE